MKIHLRITFLMASILIFMLPYSAQATTFKDVPKDHWAHDEIRFLSDKLVIRGYSSGNFQPLTTLTRKDAAVMIVRAMKLPAIQQPTVRPNDLKSSMGGYTEMMTAANKGMFTISNGKFSPNAPLTRKEMARVMAVAYNFKGTGKSNFQDMSKSHPFYSYVDAIATNNVTTGYSDGTFKPEIAVNRAQFSTFLSRIYSKPLTYIVKQNGKVIATVNTDAEAIRIATSKPGSTVHPVNNSLMVYNQKPALLTKTGIRNGVLIYNGAEYGSFSPDFFDSYVTGLEGPLFDSFVILGRTYIDGEFAETPKNKANYKEWKWYADQSFANDGALTALNDSVKAAGKKVQVHISIPYPKRSEAIILLNGTRVSNSLAEREKLVNWYIQTIQTKWNQAKYTNLTFKGYYWLNETVIHADDERLLEKVSATIHKQNKSFIYAPHALTTNFANWKYYGFDGAFLQPNSFRLALTDTEARLHKAFLNAQIHGSAITLEIDMYSPHQIDAGLINFYKYIDFANRYGLKGQSLLFYQGTGMVNRMDNYKQSGYKEAYKQLNELLNN